MVKDENRADATETDATETDVADALRPSSLFLESFLIFLLTSFCWVFVLVFLGTVWYPAQGQMMPVSFSGSLWFIPAFDLILAIALSSLAVLAGLVLERLVGSKMSRNIVLFVVLLIATMSLLIMVPSIHTYAKLVLAIGISVQLLRLLQGQRLPSIVKTSTCVLLGTTLAMASVPLLITPLLESRAVSRQRTQSGERSQQSNVLIVVLDTVRSESMSLYGHGRPTTPFLEEFAKECLVYERAIAPSSWTLPTHASMFSGKHPHELQTGFVTALNHDHRLIAESLSDQGYLSAGVVANFVYCGKRTGLQRGMIHYQAVPDWPAITDKRTITGRLLGVDLPGQGFIESVVKNYADYTYPGRKRANQINSDFFAWLDRQPGQMPFFGFLNYFDAHAPFDPLPEYLDKINSEDAEEEQVMYEACIAYIDSQLRLLVDELKKRKLLESTLLIIVSDHGEHFGEHGMDHHGNSLYSQLIHVPLLIRVPGQSKQSSLRIRRFVSLRDLPHNILKTVHCPDSQITGNDWPELYDPSLSESESAVPAPILCELQTAIRQPTFQNANGPMASLIDNQGLHYIRNFGEQEEQLFDLVADPTEKTDIANTTRGQKAIARLRNALDEITPPDLLDRLNK